MRTTRLTSVLALSLAAATQPCEFYTIEGGKPDVYAPKHRSKGEKARNRKHRK